MREYRDSHCFSRTVLAACYILICCFNNRCSFHGIPLRRIFWSHLVGSENGMKLPISFQRNCSPNFENSSEMNILPQRFPLHQSSIQVDNDRSAWCNSVKMWWYFFGEWLQKIPLTADLNKNQMRSSLETTKLTLIDGGFGLISKSSEFCIVSGLSCFIHCEVLNWLHPMNFYCLESVLIDHNV